MGLFVLREDDLYSDQEYKDLLLDQLLEYPAVILAGNLVYFRNNECFDPARERASNHKAYLNFMDTSANYHKYNDAYFEVLFLHACSLM